MFSVTPSDITSYGDLSMNKTSVTSHAATNAWSKPICINLWDEGSATIVADTDGEMTLRGSNSRLQIGPSRTYPKTLDREHCRPVTDGDRVVGWLCSDVNYGDIVLKIDVAGRYVFPILRVLDDAPWPTIIKIVGQATMTQSGTSDMD